MYVIVNGKVGNFLYSLDDYVHRRTEFIRKFPQGSFIWGARRVYSPERPGARLFLYVSRDEERGFDGGIVLVGEIKQVGELHERYWPEGEWAYYFVLSDVFVPRSIIESKDPRKWKYVTREEMEEFGLRPLPGIIKLSDEAGKKLEERLKRKS